ncbi:hypothetical protein [Halomarina litorea]|uniref:hypothetical protein n=1 Tax=Halomarina litorea TaxID=2961595 RepID=UPI0020C2BE88|nr:hypothetical protein [Halomarina sp. BCD28]
MPAPVLSLGTNTTQRFVLGALVALVGLALEEYAMYLLAVPAVLIVAVTIGYSYVLYERLEPPADGSGSA